MTDRPVESSGTGAAPQWIAPASGPEEMPLLMPTAPVPRVVVRADLLPAVSVVSLLALLGLPIGWVWSRLAPPQQSVLGENGKLTPLLVESYHEFDAIAIFVLLGFAAGLLTSAVLWLVRGRRGPVLLLAGVLGSLLASWLGVRTGASLAAGLYAMPPQAKPGDLIAVAPQVRTYWVLLAQPLAVALGYGIAASWNGLDDLGRRLR
ncbi:hypothetical protein GCM10011581_10600 [Saccharopolyspora subtropica]|uniref:DUF2567 domain-containing protein n=1 Tax=Saccharopolyspora thermophila TaxID=89367 RepID=A0A917JLH0_9PSEU|nr:DUF2567 domain-containing protein [Saccharopolyspora subtropica]GGI75415.1 hypothetical protein GCM10011581_10600 [Saccharopolyspora subtropica]